MSPSKRGFSAVAFLVGLLGSFCQDTMECPLHGHVVRRQVRNGGEAAARRGRAQAVIMNKLDWPKTKLFDNASPWPASPYGAYNNAPASTILGQESSVT